VYNVGWHIGGRYRCARAQIAATAKPCEAEVFIVGKRGLQMIKQCAQICRGSRIGVMRMQAKVIEPRLEIDRVCGSDPHRGPVSGLAPHAQRAKTRFGVRQFQFAENTGQQLLRLLHLANVRTRKPAFERWILEPAATDSWQDSDGGAFVVGNCQTMLKSQGFVRCRSVRPDGNGKPA
jgi:hypothetical protein